MELEEDLPTASSLDHALVEVMEGLSIEKVVFECHIFGLESDEIQWADKILGQVLPEARERGFLQITYNPPVDWPE